MGFQSCAFAYRQRGQGRGLAAVPGTREVRERACVEEQVGQVSKEEEDKFIDVGKPARLPHVDTQLIHNVCATQPSLTQITPIATTAEAGPQSESTRKFAWSTVRTVVAEETGSTECCAGQHEPRAATGHRLLLDNMDDSVQEKDHK